MQTQVTINNEITTLHLKPENKFEIHFIEHFPVLGSDVNVSVYSANPPYYNKKELQIDFMPSSKSELLPR